MSDLTIEKMDNANFLITEVSLECLGNKFFDVYGNQVDSLFGLISTGSLNQGTTDNDNETDLWKALTTKKPKPKVVVETKVTNEPIRQRRASFSNTNKEDTNDPESLLVPLAPKASKIANRRSTISVQMAKRKMSAPTQSTKNRKSAIEAPRKSISEIKWNLRRDINSRYNSMRLLSERQEEKYRTLNINPNMENFYKAEEKSLFAQCNTLVNFIAYIQESRENKTRLANISQAILDLQKEY